jgi:hypothetical protein
MSFSVRSASYFVACLLSVVVHLSGCVAIGNPPAPSLRLEDKLKLISAGYTGCAPQDNELSNINAWLNGDGTWNATCKEKNFLCTSVGQVEQGVHYHCAPVAQ